jgi:hypothetical protein
MATDHRIKATTTIHTTRAHNSPIMGIIPTTISTDKRTIIIITTGQMMMQLIAVPALRQPVAHAVFSRHASDEMIWSFVYLERISLQI